MRTVSVRLQIPDLDDVKQAASKAATSTRELVAHVLQAPARKRTEKLLREHRAAYEAGFQHGYRTRTLIDFSLSDAPEGAPQS
jgi:hypothetical protein